MDGCCPYSEHVCAHMQHFCRVLSVQSVFLCACATLVQGVVRTVSVSVPVCRTTAGCRPYSQCDCAHVQDFCRVLSVQSARLCPCAGLLQGVVCTVSVSVPMFKSSAGCCLYTQCVCAHVQHFCRVLSIQSVCLCACAGLLQGLVGAA